MLQLHGSVCANYGHGSMQATVLAVANLVGALHGVALHDVAIGTEQHDTLRRFKCIGSIQSDAALAS